MDKLKPFSGSDEQIEQVAQRVRRKVLAETDGHAPIGTMQVQHFLANATDLWGGTIEVANSPDWQEVDGGSLVIEKDGSFVVWLSPVTSPLRDNFTVAHELGHLFLHYHLAEPRPKGRVVVHRYGTDRVETQANRFAAALLMPKAEFVKARKKFKDDSFAIARHFGVSQPAVKVRMGYVRSAPTRSR